MIILRHAGITLGLFHPRTHRRLIIVDYCIITVTYYNHYNYYYHYHILQISYFHSNFLIMYRINYSILIENYISDI